MKAMILAAGLGTRLRPLTNDRPKALVEVAGRTLLEITLTRLREFGIREVILNVHHFAGMVIQYLKANENFGMRIELSPEETLLDTGGGLKKAAWFFLPDSKASDEPFIVHNVDVISDINLRCMMEAHQTGKALATLAVQHRESSRYLLFDQRLQLAGRRIASGGETKEERVQSSSDAEPLAFSGIHVISPQIFGKMTETGVFSIIDCYLRLAATGEKIRAFMADDYYWRDLGKPENIDAAEEDLKQRRIQ